MTLTISPREPSRASHPPLSPAPRPAGPVLWLASLCCAALLGGCVTDKPGAHADYHYAVREIVGYGPVNHWTDEDFPRLAGALYDAGLTACTIELLGWGKGNNYGNPEAVRDPYGRLLKALRARKIVLHVSLTNDNKGSGKYGDDNKGLSHYTAQIRQARQIVFDAGPEGVIVQPVGETGSDEGRRFESETIAQCKVRNFLTCWNRGSRPTSGAGCNFFAYHPAKTSDLGPSGGLTVTDHGSILTALSRGGSVYGPYSPNKVAAYIAKVHAAGRGAIHYGFWDASADYETIAAIGAAVKQQTATRTTDAGEPVWTGLSASEGRWRIDGDELP